MWCHIRYLYIEARCKESGAASCALMLHEEWCESKVPSAWFDKAFQPLLWNTTQVDKNIKLSWFGVIVFSSVDISLKLQPHKPPAYNLPASSPSRPTWAPLCTSGGSATAQPPSQQPTCPALTWARRQVTPLFMKPPCTQPLPAIPPALLPDHLSVHFRWTTPSLVVFICDQQCEKYFSPIGRAVSEKASDLTTHVCCCVHILKEIASLRSKWIYNDNGSQLRLFLCAEVSAV